MKRKGTFWIITGLLLIAAALSLTIYNFVRNVQAGETADEIMTDLRPGILTADHDVTARPDPHNIGASVEPIPEMPVRIIDGKEYVAVLHIPALELELPVCSEWSYSLLNDAPCRFSGSAYTCDLVICAHNYAAHFGRIKNLALGDSVNLVDMDGNLYSYEVVDIETMEPTRVEDMVTGDWDLTLFTCTVGGATRVAIRCKLAA